MSGGKWVNSTAKGIGVYFNKKTGTSHFYKNMGPSWTVVSVPDSHKEPNSSKVAFAINEAGGETGDYFFGVIQRTFPAYVQTGLSENDVSKIINPSNTGGGEAGDPTQGNAFYYVEKGYAIVDSRRYMVGSDAVYRGDKYRVGEDSQGFALLEYDPDTSGMAKPLHGEVQSKEIVNQRLNYNRYNYNINPNNSTTYAESTLQHIDEEERLTVYHNTEMERVVKAGAASPVNYKERFSLGAGKSTHTVEQYTDLSDVTLTTRGEDTIDDGLFISAPVREGYNTSNGVNKLTQVYPRIQGKPMQAYQITYYSHWTWVKVVEIDYSNNRIRVAYIEPSGKSNSDRKAFREKIRGIWKKGNTLTPSTYNEFLKVNPEGTESTVYNGIQSTLVDHSKKSGRLIVTGVKVSGKTAPKVTHTKYLGDFTPPTSRAKVGFDYATDFAKSKDSSPRVTLRVFMHPAGKPNSKRQLLAVSESGFGSVDIPFNNLIAGTTYRIYAEIIDRYPDTRDSVAEITNGVVTTYVGVTSPQGKATGTIELGLESSGWGQATFTNGDTFMTIKPPADNVLVEFNVPLGTTTRFTAKYIQDKNANESTNRGNYMTAAYSQIAYTVFFRGNSSLEQPDEDISSVIPEPPNWWEYLPPDWGEVVEPPEEGEEGTESEEPFVWIDDIQLDGVYPPEFPEEDMDELMEANTCYSDGTIVSLDYVGGGDWDEFLANSDWSTHYSRDIDMFFYNDSPHEMVFDIRYEVDRDDDCRAFNNYYNGGFEYQGKGQLEAPQIGERDTDVIIDMSMDENNHKIVGGDNGSYLDLIVLADGAPIYTKRIHEGMYEEEFITPNMLNSNAKEYEFKAIFTQKGIIDEDGRDLRSEALLSFDIDVEYVPHTDDDLGSKLEFFIDGERVLLEDKTNTDTVTFPITKGKHDYKFRFSTNKWDYNWDFARIPWIRLTNWMCRTETVVPYCEPFGGDICIEALIESKLKHVPPLVPGEPDPSEYGCYIVRGIEKATGAHISTGRRDFEKPGEHEVRAPRLVGWRLVPGEPSVKTVTVVAGKVCAEVEFYYEHDYTECVIVEHIEANTGQLMRKVKHSNLPEGKNSFGHIAIPGYRPVGVTEQIVDIKRLDEAPTQCHLLVFQYVPRDGQDPEKWCVTEIHQEKDNPANVLGNITHTNLEVGEYQYASWDLEGWSPVPPYTQKVVITEDTPNIVCITVVFEYVKEELGCVEIKHIDKETGDVLDTEFYKNMPLGEYEYHSAEFEGYELVSESPITVIVDKPQAEECARGEFHYMPKRDGAIFRRKIWIFT